MKKISFLFLLVFISCISANARIWRVNNNPGVTADFTTAQDAHDAANAGDTIHLEPSPVNYGNIVATKHLVWISIGSFLIENPGKQYSSIPGKPFFVNANAGSEGSVFSVVCAGMNISASNISIIRSHITGGGSLVASGNSIEILQSFISGGVTISGANAVVNNNIFSAIITSATSSSIISNNVIFTNSGFGNIYNAVFQNNISGGMSYLFNNSTVSYNIDAGNTIPAGNNNQLNVDLNTVFVTFPGFIDNDYLLKPGSPATGSGFGGVDRGAFGGSTAFVLALQPAIPAITDLSAPSSTGGNTIQVTFSAKSNN